MASSFKGLTGSQSGGPGREDVVHEPDRAVGSFSVHGEGLERPDQVGFALAFVQMVLAYPGTGVVQQLCRRPAQSQDNGSKPLSPCEGRASASRHVVQGADGGSGLSQGPSQIGQRGSIRRVWAKLRGA